MVNCGNHRRVAKMMIIEEMKKKEQPEKAEQFKRMRCFILLNLHPTVAIWHGNIQNKVATVQHADTDLDKWTVSQRLAASF